MKKFYERDGEIYSVENVFTRDGKLVTKAGDELKPPTAFHSVETKSVAQPTDNERLMRRGQ